MPCWSLTLESLCLLREVMDVVRDAVLVAAGLGTRMFPTSAFSPKESLPLVDVPLLTHLVMEAKAANIERLHVVVSPTKSFEPWMEDRRSLHALQSHLDQALFNATDGLEILYHVQHEPKGVGNAIEAALDAINGPFLVMLGDNLLMDVHATATDYRPSQASKRLVEAFQNHGQATVGLMEVRPARCTTTVSLEWTGTASPQWWKNQRQTKPPAVWLCAAATYFLPKPNACWQPIPTNSTVIYRASHSKNTG